jgi:MATE family multidrug resistance protein
MGATDAIVAGRAGVHEQAIVGLSVSIWIPLIVFFTGCLSPLVSECARVVAGGTDKFIKLRSVGIILSLLLLVLLPLIYIFVSKILAYAKVEPSLAVDCLVFLVIIFAGIPASLLYRTLNFSWLALGITRPMFAICVVAVPLNIIIASTLCFGWLGFPKLGALGCAISTTICMWVMLLLAIFYERFAKNSFFKISLKNIYFSDIISFSKIAIPSGVVACSDVLAFGAVGVLASKFGEPSVAAFQIALNFSAMLFMIPYGISSAINMLTAQSLGGEHGISGAVQYILAGHKLSFLFAVAMSLLLLFGANFIASLYTSDDEVLRIASGMLTISIVWQIADAIQICNLAALRAFRVTTLPMLLSLLCFWGVAVPVGYFLSLGHESVKFAGLGVIGLWGGLTLGIILLALSSSLLLTSVVQKNRKIKFPDSTVIALER